jgi:hypothetical protein
MTTTSTTSMCPTDARLLYEHYGLTCPPRWGTMRNFDRPTYGGKVAKIARALGTPLMPWQRYVADTSLEVDPETGLLVYRGVDTTVPRQSGKTSLILPTAVWRALRRPRQRIVYGAQTGVAALEKWEDEHLPMIESAKALNGKFRVRKGAARQGILWGNGSIHGLLANTQIAGHGKVLDAAFLDEYFAQVDHRSDQAVGPAMITRIDAQKWRLSTAGTSASVPFNAMRKAGRERLEAGAASTTAFFDWTALAGAPRDSFETWLSCMPALCPAPVRGRCRCSKEWRHTTSEAAIRSEYESFEAGGELEEFDRAYLNIGRDDGELDRDPNVPTPEEWALLADKSVEGGDLVVLALDITPRRDYAAIVAVGDTALGLPRVRILDHGAGVEWLLPRILELHERLKPVCWVLDDKSAAGTLVLPMERKGIVRMPPETDDRDARKGPQRGQLWIPTVGQYGAACGTFTDTVRQGGLVHSGQDGLTVAIEGAATRPLGDGLWGWGRKIGSADISPLVAATLGLAGLDRWRHLAEKRVVIGAVNTTVPSSAGMFRPGGRLSL